MNEYKVFYDLYYSKWSSERKFSTCDVIKGISYSDACLNFEGLMKKEQEEEKEKGFDRSYVMTDIIKLD